MQRGENQRCRKKLVARRGSMNWRLRWENVFQALLLYHCLWSSLLAHKWIENQKQLFFEYCLLVRIFNSKKIRLAKNIFRCLIKVSSKKMFNPLNTIGRFLFEMDLLLKKVSQLWQRKDWKFALFLFSHLFSVMRMIGPTKSVKWNNDPLMKRQPVLEKHSIGKIPSVRRHVLCKNYSKGTNPSDRETACLRKIFC